MPRACPLKSDRQGPRWAPFPLLGDVPAVRELQGCLYPGGVSPGHQHGKCALHEALSLCVQRPCGATAGVAASPRPDRYQKEAGAAMMAQSRSGQPPRGKLILRALARWRRVPNISELIPRGPHVLMRGWT